MSLLPGGHLPLPPGLRLDRRAAVHHVERPDELRMPTLRPETGQALLLVIIMVTFFAVVVVAVLEISGATGRNAKRENSHDSALSVAEAGVANGLSVLANSPRPLDPSALPSSSSPQVEMVEGKAVSWFGTLTGDTWTITAMGSVPSPVSGAGTIKRVVHIDARVGSTAMNPAWGYVYAADVGCLTLASSADVKEPVYTRGNLCLNNSSRVTGSPVHVDGHIDTFSTASVGVPGTPISELHVGSGCSYSGGSYTFPCAAAEHVYTATQDQVAAGVKKPPVDLPYWYSHARPGPTTACDAPGSFPGGFDNDGSMNRSLPNVNLFASNYDCRVIVGGTQLGRIAYTAGSPGSFVIDGTVFVDGNIVMNGSEEVLYSGRGTIYASGTIDLQGSQQICGAWAGGCDFTAWDPDVNMLVLVSGSTTDNPSFNTGQSLQFQGGIYAAGNYTQGSSVEAEGPRIGETLTISGSSQASIPAFSYLPPGAPMEAPVVVTPGWKG